MCWFNIPSPDGLGRVGCGYINQSEAHTGNNPAYLVDRTDHVLFLKTLYPAALRSFKH